MNNLIKKIGIFGLAILSIGVVASCGKKQDPNPDPNPGVEIPDKPEDNDFDYANVVDVNGEYTIFPTVQDAEYLEKGFVLKKDSVNVVLEAEIDAESKERLETILNENSLKFAYSDKGKDDYVNILVGVHNSGGYVDKYFADKAKPTENLFEKMDAYELYINNGVVAILGKDVLGAFYGINTLNQILNFAEANDNKLRNVKISDYAVTERRGVIEGFYGYPWTIDERIEVMRWGSYYKMNNYAFAPKDDVYHSSKWRELYPKAKLADMSRIAEAANSYKVEFTWAIHPFMHGTPFDFNNYDAELMVVKAKFEQLYSIGVRSFALSADDIAVPQFTGDDAAAQKTAWFRQLAENHLKITDDLVAWGKTLGEPVKWQFIPTVYCGTNDTDYLMYLNLVGNSLNAEVGQHWTGEQVYGTLSKETVTDFKERTGRLPVFWLNSPVNDSFGVCENIFMPRMTVLHTDVEAISGLLVNPSPYLEPSKIAIFQALDYSWNIKGFDSGKSYRQSFNTIEEDMELAEQLYIFASNLQSTEHLSNGWIPQLNSEESPLLIPYMAPLLEKIDANLIGSDIIEYTKPLRDELNKVVNAINTYRKTGNNKALVEDILVWMYSLRDLCNAGLKYLECVEALAANNLDTARSLLATANAAVISSQSKYTKPIYIIETSTLVYAATGEVTIQPFYKSLSKAINSVLGN